jgi:ABC transport system ATP-binding/permease protein
MSPRPWLGAQTLSVGGASDSDIVIEGPQVLAHEAEIVRQEEGKLWLLPAPGSAWLRNGVPLETLEPLLLEYHDQLTTHGAVLDLEHPLLAQMLLSRGSLPYQFGELSLGRDPAECHLVLGNPGVSGLHATLHFPPVAEAPVLVVDRESTSGTWVRGERLAPEALVPVSDDDVIALGPVLIPIRLLRTLHDQALFGSEPLGPETEAPGRPGARLGRTSRRHHTVVGTVQLGAARQWKIGRRADNALVLDYPQISAHHATLVALAGQLFLEDVGSELGTLVRNEPLRPGQRVPVQAGETIQFGPLLARLDVIGESVSLGLLDDESWIGRPLLEIEADHVTVKVPDRTRHGSEKILLDEVSFKALPGDLIALMGPSGAGKTTLLHALSGYLAPSSGQVRVNGRPLPEVFDALRGSIGYVPQDDIIHPELTVREAVTYSARLRLPSDFSNQEISTRVGRTLRELGLEGVAHLQIGKPEAKVLSGGQRKRVNIAIELVTDPVLLLLDEPTSGLAADDTAQLVALLERLARTGGRTIIATIHQPARREYERFNLALVLGPGGIPLYFGPSPGAYHFFAAWRPPESRPVIDNPRDMFAEMKTRAEMLGDTDLERAREAVSLLYRREYESSTTAREMTEGRRALGESSQARLGTRRRSVAKKELGLLLSRALRIKFRDRVSTAILLLQAPLIALLLGLVFGGQRPTPPAWCWGALHEIVSQEGGPAIELISDRIPELAPTQDRSAALFFLVVSAIWFGTSNAAREIVAERAIFRRESMVHLSTFNYVASKFLILSALCVVQCATLLGIAWFLLGLGGGGPAFVWELGMLTLTALCAVALGLLISGLVTSSEAAMALTPLALIPQVVLGGLMVPVTTVPWLKLPMLLIPARWGFEGVVRPERLAAQDSPAWNIELAADTPSSFAYFIDHARFRCGLAHLESSELLGALGFGAARDPRLPALALALMTAVLLAGVLVRLRRPPLMAPRAESRPAA